MRISETAPHLTAAAQASFSNSQATNLQPNPLDGVLPAPSVIRYYLERGQAFELFSKTPTFELAISDGAGASRYNCMTIKIDVLQIPQIKGFTSPTFSIYKDVDTGSLYLGDRQAVRNKRVDFPMSEREIAMQMLKWSRTFAGANVSKQSAFLSTFSMAPIPEQGATLRAAKSAINEVASYWRRAFA